MLNKKKTIIAIMLIIFLLIFILIYYFLIKDREVPITEYVPQEEISQEQMRTTIVNLFFEKDGELVNEARLIDVKDLINNPYGVVLQLLLDGPKSEEYKKIIADGTKINKVDKKGDILIIDFSNEFIENHEGGELKENLTIQSILKTMSEFNEINGIKIIIEGEENKGFKDNIISFKNIFIR